MFQHYALSSYALTCALLSTPSPTSNMYLGGPQGSFLLCAIFGAAACSSPPKQHLTESKILQILFAGDLWPTQLYKFIKL